MNSDVNKYTKRGALEWHTVSRQLERLRDVDLREEMDEIYEALTSQSEWQCISVAPRNGDRIYAYAPPAHYGVVAFDGRDWESVDGHGVGLNIGFFPTHWQPLTPPQDKDLK